MDENIIIEGVVKSIIYQDPENGYIIFVLAVLEPERIEITCTGYVPSVHEGENVKALGHFIVHPSYGDQFRLISYEKTLPTTVESIEKYLSSGIIEGIGKAYAKRIVDNFGEDTLKIIENSPEKLAKLKGITKKRAYEIHRVFTEQIELRNTIMFLQKYGVSTKLALKIFNKYKDQSIKFIKENPYKLADEVSGIGFKTADEIANNIGIKKDSIFRLKSGVKFTLKQSSKNGHVYLPKDELILSSSALLSIDKALIESAILELQIDNTIWINNNNDIYLNYLYYAENYSAKKLIELSKTHSIGREDSTLKHIEALEVSNNITLAQRQIDAIVQSMQAGVLVITGGPGTGKTTTINTIIGVLQKDGYDIILTAPTGRAAKKMTEATGEDAMTIHRLLGASIGEDTKFQVFDRNEDNPIDADVIIVDESSMIDISLLHHLLMAIEIGTRIIFVGDVDQLPSVGAGNVLKDIINSGHIKIVRLEEIFRQAKESAIIMNAHKINRGEKLELQKKTSDFFFMERFNQDDAVNTLIELITKRLPKYKKCNPFTDIQILCPSRRGALGVESLNQVLQNTLNPPSLNKREKIYGNTIFRMGDKVMQLRNNYKITWKLMSNAKRLNEGVGVYNGDEGLIISIDKISGTMTVCFDGNKYVDYDFSQLDELALSYAITVHKSQGSEYKVVIIPIHSGPPMLFTRNLLYTAVTRGKELCVIVGKQNMLYSMIDNKKETMRYSSLDIRLKEMYKSLSYID